MIELEQFKSIVNSNIDGRTSEGIVLKRIKSGLEKGGKQTLIEVYRNILTLNILLHKRLVDSILSQESVIDEKGRLIPAVRDDLKNLEKSNLSYVKMLNELEDAADDDISLEDM